MIKVRVNPNNFFKIRDALIKIGHRWDVSSPYSYNDNFVRYLYVDEKGMISSGLMNRYFSECAYPELTTKNI